jgi:uncharacterized protein
VRSKGAWSPGPFYGIGEEVTIAAALRARVRVHLPRRERDPLRWRVTQALLVAIAFAGFTVEASIGFGSALVTITLGMLLLPLGELLPAYLPVNVVLSAYLVARYHRQIAWRFLLRVLLLMGIGLPLGLVAVSRVDASILRRAFGVFVAALAALELLRRRGVAGPPGAAPEPRAFDAAVLVLGGAVHGAFATGGPMAVYVSGRALPDKASFRASLSLLWLVLNTLLVAAYVARGDVGRVSLERSALLVGSLAAGVVAGELLHRRVPQASFRTVVFALLLVAGVALLARG